MTTLSSTTSKTPLRATNRVFRLVRRPVGVPSAANFTFTEEPLPSLSEGQALVRTRLLSVDPTTRVWMSDYRGYLPPAPMHEPMRGLGVGQVVDTRRDDLPIGAWVLGWTDWQDYCLADDTRLLSPFTVLPDPLPAPPEAFLGVLGHTGITAYLGIDIGKPQSGETVVVSAASGSVGSVAGS